jgi:hypothetical protein
LAEGKVIRIDSKYFANDPHGPVDQLIDAEAARLDAYLRSVPDALARSGSKLRRAVKDNALASVALERLLETGQVIEFKYKKQPFGTLTPTIRSGASFSRNITGSRSRSLVAGGSSSLRQGARATARVRSFHFGFSDRAPDRLP